MQDRNLFCCAGRPHGDLCARRSGFIDEDAQEVSGNGNGDVACCAFDAHSCRCAQHSSRGDSTFLNSLSFIPAVEFVSLFGGKNPFQR